MSAGAPELAVVIPTRDRCQVLLETIDRLGATTAAAAPVEMVIVDDGSTDGTAERIADRAPSLPWPVRVLRQERSGPAAARNRGMREACAAVCLFIGDDTRPAPGMVERHLAFHGEHPTATDAMLGKVVPAPPLDASPFVRWLHERGTQFGYALLDPAKPVPPECFWTSNVSVKREFALDAGGFDEGFPAAACEDAELGLRLARRGMRLRYDPDALGEHYHPTDLEHTLRRMQSVGIAYRRLCELAPEMPEPRRPGGRHRLKAAVLTALMATHLRPMWLRETTWRFLCDEVQREAYWEAADRSEPAPSIGSHLARVAVADPLANPSAA